MNDVFIPDVLTEDEMRGNFRLASARYLLTYSSQIEKTILLSMLSKGEKPFKNIESWGIAHEIGDTGYPHTHILLKFSKRIDTINPRFFDIFGIHPNIRKISTIEHWENSIIYLKKDDPEPSFSPDLVIFQKKEKNENRDKILQSKIMSYHGTADDFIRQYNPEITKINVIISAFNYKKRVLQGMTRDLPVEIRWREWQRVLIDLVRFPENYDRTYRERKIIWIYDPLGSAGKSFFVAVLCEYFKLFSIVSLPAASAIYHSYLTYYASVNEKHSSVIFWDLPRYAQLNQEFYCVAETLKNGNFTSSKYQSTSVSMGHPPIVIVLGNILPDFGAFTCDRYHIIEVNENDIIRQFSIEDIFLYMGYPNLKWENWYNLLPSGKCEVVNSYVHDDRTRGVINSFKKA